MSERSTLHTHKTAMPTVTPAQGVSLQRACACGQHTGGGECTACKGKRLGTLQRAAVNSMAVGTVPPSVHDVLNSPGQPLDAVTHSFMSSRFGHDFSQVRVHTDAKAAESARAVNALAYTVGNNIVFGAGQYHTDSTTGKRLLAHELTHTIQQAGRIGLALANSSISEPGDTSEREADRVAEVVLANQTGIAPFIQAFSPSIARQENSGQSTNTAQSPYERFIQENLPFWVEFLRQNGITPEQLATIPAPQIDSQAAARVVAAGTAPALAPRPIPAPPVEVPLPGGPGGRVIPFPSPRPPVPTPTPTPRPRPVPVPPATVAWIIAIAIMLYPSETAPAWMDEINQVTGEPYHSPDEYRIFRRFSPQQEQAAREWLRRLRQPELRPETGPQPVPTPDLAQRRRRRNLRAYPLCWTELLPPPIFRNGLPVMFFIRTPSERDEEEARQARNQLNWRQFRDPDFDPRRYHVHHIIPLFLGGPDDLLGVNGITWPKELHLRGHNQLKRQPQMADPTRTAPLPPLSSDLYDHPAGIPYELVGYKGMPPCEESGPNT